MACGCGGSNSGGPLLSGVLDPAYADQTPDDSGIAAAADDGGSIQAMAQFRSRGFWLLLVVFVVGAAWYVDSKKRGDS
jgi:hypothetical protein